MGPHHVKSGASEDLKSGSETLPDGERRDALKKIVKYSAYSAPALLALMQSAKASAVSGLID